MKLRGTEPTESIDLSQKGLTVLSATIIGSLIGSNTTLTSVNLEYNFVGKEGAEALAGALKDNKALTSLKYAAAHP